jgi:hypothetical protein
MNILIIRQPGVMTRDAIAEESPACPNFVHEFRPGSRMIDTSCDLGAMWVITALNTRHQVFLKGITVLSDVVPQSG